MAKVTLSLNIESDTSAIARSINDFASSKLMRNLIPFFVQGVADVLRAHGHNAAGLDHLARDQEGKTGAEPEDSTSDAPDESAPAGA